MRKISFYVGKKNIITFLAASIILLFGIYSFVDDIVYFFSSNEPIDLHEAMELDKAAFEKLKDGDYVQVKGITSVQGGAMKKGLSGQKYILYYLSGSPKFIVNEKIDEDPSGPQYKTVRGRAYGFKTNSNAAKMRNFFANSLFIEMDEDGYLIQAGVEPGSDYMSLLFFVVLILAMGLNIFLFLKPFKPQEDLMEDDIDEI